MKDAMLAVGFLILAAGATVTGYVLASVLRPIVGV
jgi:hypothetical protein